MKEKGHVVLITGGGSGIGLALAEQFLKKNNKVIITGRNKEKLKKAKEKFPQIETVLSDITKKEDRLKLTEKYQDINILINNAGIQFNYVIHKNAEAGELIDDEIEINFTGPISLIKIFLPILIKNKNPAVINVSSGLAFVPKESAPVYCATKGGLHIFTKSLRYQLESAGVKVFEIMPPLVDTEMTSGRGRGKISPGQLAEEFWKNFLKNKYEMHIGKVKILYFLNRLVPNIAERIMRPGL